MSRYLITGGLGFVGNEVVRQLMQQEEVYILDNCNRTAPRCEDIAMVPSFVADINDSAKVLEIFNEVRPEFVIHLAAIHYIPECNQEPCRTLRVNVEGTRSILDAAAKSDVKHVVITSSGAVYADSHLPLVEDKSDVLPVDIYGYSKLFCEGLAKLHYSETSMPVTTTRLFNVYGPRETNPHIIPEILTQLKSGSNLTLGNITTRRDFIFVKDAAEGFIRLANCIPETGFRSVNLGTGIDYSMSDIISMIGRLLERNIDVKFDESRTRKVDKQIQVADTAQLGRILSWIPTRSLEDGMRDLLVFEGLLNA